MKTTKDRRNSLRGAIALARPHIGLEPSEDALSDLLDDFSALEEWALRAKWYLDSNCAGQDGADRLRAALDRIYT